MGSFFKKKINLVSFNMLLYLINNIYLNYQKLNFRNVKLQFFQYALPYMGSTVKIINYVL